MTPASETQKDQSAVSDPTAAPAQADTSAERHHRKVREGLVVSDKMDKTVVVAVEDRVKHALYGKVLRQTSRLKLGLCNGDTSLIGRPRAVANAPRRRHRRAAAPGSRAQCVLKAGSGRVTRESRVVDDRRRQTPRAPGSRAYANRDDRP